MSFFKKGRALKKSSAVVRSVGESGPVINELDIPTIDQVIPGDPEGLILLKDSYTDLDIKVPIWTDRAPSDPFVNKLHLEWLPEGEAAWVNLKSQDVPASVPDEDFPLKIKLDNHFFENRSGAFSIRYAVDHWAGTGSTNSFDTPLFIDRQSPQFVDVNPTIEVDALVTDDLLAANGGVFCVIPDFTERHKEDVLVAVAWLDKVVPEIPADTDLAFLGPLPLDRKILIPADKITPLGSGLHFVLCVLVDKAGNKSILTLPAQVAVALGKLPSDLADPRIPQADDGIDRNDAFEQIKVLIDSITDYLPEDGIVIDWEGVLTDRISIEQLLPFPLAVPVPWLKMKALYDFVEGGDQPVTVKYQVLRGVTPTPSNDITVQTNFEFAGPPNPDEPDPVNKDLDEVEIWGSSTTPNILVLADENLPATAKIRLYDNPAVGDTLTVYWDGNVLSSAPYVVDGTQTPNQVIELEVPWADIVVNPINLQLPTFYTVTRAGLKNPQLSLPTDVNVQVVAIELPEAVFQRRYMDTLLNCNSLVEKGGVYGIEVLIPKSQYLVPGETIELFWRSYDDEWSPIDGTYWEATHKVTEQEKEDGIMWFVPYTEYLLPTYGGSDHQFGFGQFLYRITIHGNATPSPQAQTMVAMGAGAGGGSCEIPPAP
ncbi:hypothetical protein [Pseudomonas helleri]|uniref:hypothetical protein n=1 Tax=Pseudomonas helleri TaxID=1608996 RepID=UPI0028ED5EA8|nr:hypothetical protein [Pseudomonas helleri]